MIIIYVGIRKRKKFTQQTSKLQKNNWGHYQSPRIFEKILFKSKLQKFLYDQF